MTVAEGGGSEITALQSMLGCSAHCARWLPRPQRCRLVRALQKRTLIFLKKSSASNIVFANHRLINLVFVFSFSFFPQRSSRVTFACLVHVLFFLVFLRMPIFGGPS